MRAIRLATILVLAACQPAEPPFMPDIERFDLLIENGQVFDGTGADAKSVDVLIADDRIVYVGQMPLADDERRARIERTIDAAGRVVTPGFIDLHSHGDPLTTPAMENFIAMGVTTISLGQDGSSPDVVPLSDWMDDVRDTGIGTNVAMFVGHGTLRTQSGIGRSTSPTDEQLASLSAALDDALKYTFGMSTGLEYNPGLNASTEELRMLARVVGANDRMIMSHMRNEDDGALNQSIAELLEQGEDARVHVAHLKSVYGKGVERAEQILNILENARENSIEITADVYPYTASYTGIAILFPVWAKTRDQFDIAKVERRDELADYLRNRVELRNGPEATLLGTDPWTGKTLASLAHELEMSFEDVLIDVIGPDGASGAYFVMNDELQDRLIQDPAIGVSSDGSPTGFHPRGHGTFARIIQRFVVERGLLTLADAIHKMTGFAANVLGIEDRGLIAEGMKADVLIFDPNAVRETATFPNPLQLAQGFDIVIINGQIARENGRLSPEYFGRVLVP